MRKSVLGGWEKVEMADRIYIFGAHSRAQTTAVYLQTLYPGLSVEAYLYNNEEPNPEEIGDIPVIRLEAGRLCTKYPVYIGTRGIYHEEIARELRNFGFEKIIPMDAGLDIRLRNAYMERHFAERGREFLKIGNLKAMEDRTSAAVYVAKSIHDAPLRRQYREEPYEKLIQVGAALTGRRLPGCLVTDDIGDNISTKNRQFCELTALYWIWKNADENIVGLAHYRRHFILPPDWIGRMLANRVDVILPVPLYVMPNLRENFKKRHDSVDWDYMMAYLRERDSQEAEQAETFFEGSLYSPCNMFIMRREVLDELCGWLFPILFAVAEHGGTREDGYGNRYPGFLSERLLSFFFEKYRERYKTVYSDKSFLD